MNQRNQIDQIDLVIIGVISYVLDWNFAPCAGREIFQFEWTVLNAPESGHFMPQGLVQSSDFTVFPWIKTTSRCDSRPELF